MDRAVKSFKLLITFFVVLFIIMLHKNGSSVTILDFLVSLVVISGSLFLTWRLVVMKQLVQAGRIKIQQSFKQLMLSISIFMVIGFTSAFFGVEDPFGHQTGNDCLLHGYSLLLIWIGCFVVIVYSIVEHFFAASKCT